MLTALRHGIRKADDLFAVMWLSKDTLETALDNFYIRKSLKFIENSDIIYT